MALSDLTELAVTKAIDEFNELGRDAFLEKYQFGPARGYLLQKDGQSYDSKAIAGAAHGYLPGQKALTADQFSGGAATVQKVLEALGFTILHPDLPSPGDVLGNNEISQQFVVGNLGGMRRSSRRNLLVLISDPFKGSYQDRWEGCAALYGHGAASPMPKIAPLLNPKKRGCRCTCSKLTSCKSLQPTSATKSANSGLMHRNKFVLFATSLPRLSIGCAITGLIATSVSNHAGRPADVWSNADSWVAKPSQAVQYRRD
jgi:5-methylcytosine-specific restriction protein A